MGSAQDKLEKKRMKAQYKLEKKHAKHQPVIPQEDPDVPKQNSSQTEQKVRPWYKDPGWLRAVVGILSLIVAIIAIVLSFYF